MFYRLLLLLAALVLVGCGGPKIGPREAAALFFEQCASGQTAAAYQSSAQAFQFERTQLYFEARVRDLGLDQVKSVVWGEAEPKGDTHRVMGAFRVKDDQALTLQVTMAKLEGAWRLLGAKLDGRSEDAFAVLARSADIAEEQGKAFLEPVATAMPPERQLQLLVEKTLMDFNEAIQGNNFAAFYETISDRWKYRGKDPRALNYSGTNRQLLEESDPHNRANRITLGSLKTAFQPFVEGKVDLAPLRGKKMILSSPAHITSDGVLTLAGRYEEFVFQAGFGQKAHRVGFKFEYVFEGSSWRLFGITVHLIKSDAAAGASPL